MDRMDFVKTKYTFVHILQPSGYVAKMHKSKLSLGKIHSLYKNDFFLTEIMIVYRIISMGATAM